MSEVAVDEGTCYPCPHGGAHEADYCRLCEQNTGEDEGPDWCSTCDSGEAP